MAKESASYSQDLQKHTENFLTLCTGQRTLTRNKKSLCYRNTPLHRFVDQFVIQGGDVIKGDGSGGESICKSHILVLPSQVVYG